MGEITEKNILVVSLETTLLLQRLQPIVAYEQRFSDSCRISTFLAADVARTQPVLFDPIPAVTAQSSALTLHRSITNFVDISAKRVGFR